MSIHESGEDYLEAILILGQESHHVRSVDVAAFLGVTKPSVSRAMSILRTNNYIIMGDDGGLKLTDSGRQIAESIYARHRFFTDLLTHLGVAQEIAAADACRIEHVISEESFQKLKEYVERTLPREDNDCSDAAGN